MDHFTVKEASEKLGISARAVRKRCEKNNVTRKNGTYYISFEILIEWQEEILLKAEKVLQENFRENLQKELVPQVVPQNENNELKKEIDALKLAFKTLDAAHAKLKQENKILLDHKKEYQELKEDIQATELAFKVNEDQIKKLKQENQELKDELSKYDIADNERIEVFTNQEYQIFETRLREWYSLQKDIEHKDELFDAKEKSLTELLEHYKTQLSYQKQQSTKILDMHQKLLDTIDKQSNLAIQRNVIEALEKDVINKDWKPKGK